MALDLAGIFSNLAGMGFFEFVVPWLLFLIIIDAVLIRVAKDSMGLNNQKTAIIAAILAFFIINFSPVNIGLFLTNFFGNASMYLAALLVLILFLGMGGVKLEELPGGKPVYGIVVLLIALVIFNGVSPGGIPFLDLSTEDVTLLFVIVLIVGVVWILGSEKGEGKPEAVHGKTA